jgi:DNA-directed RNA polymerase subunit RPC12/RpoP
MEKGRQFTKKAGDAVAKVARKLTGKSGTYYGCAACGHEVDKKDKTCWDCGSSRLGKLNEHGDFA